MKTINITFVVFLSIICYVSTQECDSFESSTAFGIGRRQPGDQLLFREIKSGNWSTTSEHIITFEYMNNNITSWEIGMHPGYSTFSRLLNWNPQFLVRLSFFATEFQVVLTAYGYPTENLQPIFNSNIAHYEGKIISINNLSSQRP